MPSSTYSAKVLQKHLSSNKRQLLTTNSSDSNPLITGFPATIHRGGLGPDGHRPGELHPGRRLGSADPRIRPSGFLPRPRSAQSAQPLAPPHTKGRSRLPGSSTAHKCRKSARAHKCRKKTARTQPAPHLARRNSCALSAPAFPVRTYHFRRDTSDQ